MSEPERTDPLALPFDQYQRYRFLSEILGALFQDNECGPLLEVGGYPVLIDRFLPDKKITVLDQPALEHPLYIQGDGRSLPFPDHAFDGVVSLDVLEHINHDERKLFLAELVRCTRRFIILAAPFGINAARDAERIIFDFIRMRGGYEHRFFREHLEIPGPDPVETESYFISQKFHTLILPNGRLDRWLMMMGIYYFLDTEPGCAELLRGVMSFYNSNYYASDNAEPAYRHFIVAVRDELQEKLGRVTGLCPGEASVFFSLDPIRAVIEGLALDTGRIRDGRIAELEDLLKVKDREIRGLRDRMASLEDFADKVKSTPLYGIYERLFKKRG